MQALRLTDCEASEAGRHLHCELAGRNPAAWHSTCTAAICGVGRVEMEQKLGAEERSSRSFVVAYTWDEHVPT
ncbi:hypothetical protein CTRI78_v008504 [Colletotrichum trifolii]|uniref:Uncharacterized protein n=1 Tax=Colletotrichum trifolii TaxID=5466 RepID=A0A4R8QVY6_COLTR|nr:hypothetical protein CTRI78_v008504 [Colletotrichum trifolii]